MDNLWCEPGSGFSDEWLGFKRSVDKRASGRHFAKCKYCGQTMDGRLPNLRKHKLICLEYAAQDQEQDVLPTESYYETTEHTEDPDTEVVYEGHEDSDEIIIKPEVAKRMKKEKIHFRKSRPFVVPVRNKPATPLAYEAANTSSSSSSRPAPSTSRYEDIVRVWARKLEELQPAQALQVEKNVNDLLYEATLANIQFQTPINVNITEGAPE